MKEFLSETLDDTSDITFGSSSSKDDHPWGRPPREITSDALIACSNTINRNGILAADQSNTEEDDVVRRRSNSPLNFEEIINILPSFLISSFHHFHSWSFNIFL